jgi:hypothetical protein
VNICVWRWSVVIAVPGVPRGGVMWQGVNIDILWIFVLNYYTEFEKG